MIFTRTPSNWKELQFMVYTIFSECGYLTESPKKLHSVRSETIEVDVYAEDNGTVKQVIVCECKHWESKVPQSVVHAFRTQVDDIGANTGFIISKNGFQKGATSAVNSSNVRLLTWSEFDSLFEVLWYQKFFLPNVAEITDAFIEYNEPINTRIFRKADVLDEGRQLNFKKLREKHFAMFALCALLSASNFTKASPSLHCNPIELPLHKNQAKINEIYPYPSTVEKATSYKDLLYEIEKYVVDAIKEFDYVFGERA